MTVLHRSEFIMAFEQQFHLFFQHRTDRCPDGPFTAEEWMGMLLGFIAAGDSLVAGAAMSILAQVRS